MSTLSVPERVANGVRWLDANRPGWRDQVSNLDQLDIASGRLCVLGQTGGYTAGCELLLGGPLVVGCTSPVLEHGFTPGWLDLHELNAEWKRVIHSGRTSVAKEMVAQ